MDTLRLMWTTLPMTMALNCSLIALYSSLNMVNLSFNSLYFTQFSFCFKIKKNICNYVIHSMHNLLICWVYLRWALAFWSWAISWAGRKWPRSFRRRPSFVCPGDICFFLPKDETLRGANNGCPAAVHSRIV